jgi:hypothetical protein
VTALRLAGILCSRCGHDTAYHVELHGGPFCFAIVRVADGLPLSVYCECSQEPTP